MRLTCKVRIGVLKYQPVYAFLTGQYPLTLTCQVRTNFPLFKTFMTNLTGHSSINLSKTKSTDRKTL